MMNDIFWDFDTYWYIPSRNNVQTYATTSKVTSCPLSYLSTNWEYNWFLLFAYLGDGKEYLPSL